MGMVLYHPQVNDVLPQDSPSEEPCDSTIAIPLRSHGTTITCLAHV